MKDILGHKSWTKDELIDILCKTGTYTCPTLPHYRYDRVKGICRDLMKRGFLKKSGKTDTGINLIVTDFFKQWQEDFKNGKTPLSPIKYHKKIKAENAVLLKKRQCKTCKEEYEPSQINQKFCSKQCKRKSK